MYKAIAELDETGVLDLLEAGRLLTVPGPSITVSRGNTLLCVEVLVPGSGGLVIALTATPRYRAAGWKWLADAFDPNHRFKEQLGQDGAVPYVLDHIDWQFEEHAQNSTITGPYRSLRDFLDDVRPWSHIAHWFAFSAADARQYDELMKTKPKNFDRYRTPRL
jgi:hypothetical protein